MIINLNKQKAAMFGLDARIALAIFGALSVISGSALYSAIQKTKITALIAELNEVGKAWESFYLDTGQHLVRWDTDSSNSNYYRFHTQGLVIDPGYTGWKGPYINYKTSSYSLDHPVYHLIMIMQLDNSDDWNYWASGRCNSGDSCSLWIYLSGFNDEDSTLIAIDEMIDGGDGATSGNIRYETGSSGTLTYKYMPIKNPHS